MVDTFVPNDVYIAGGTHEVGVSGEQDDGSGGEAPNVVICTGANACGKVCDVFYPFLYSISETLCCAERLPEAGKYIASSSHSTYQRRLLQTALIQYMAQVSDRLSCLPRLLTRSADRMVNPHPSMHCDAHVL